MSGDFAYSVCYTSATTKYSTPATVRQLFSVVKNLYMTERVCYHSAMESGANLVDVSKIRHLREKESLTQDFVAEKLGLSRPSYALIEQGTKDITVRQLYKLADVLGVAVSDISLGLQDKELTDYEKFKALILACLKAGADNDGKITKTKLAKLVYLADFNWFYHHNKSMTGAVYRCIARGPVADDYFRALDEMSESEIVAIESRGPALMISMVEESGTDKLSAQEHSLIEAICQRWRGHLTSEIVEFTHRQSPWKNSVLGSVIPYELILSEPEATLY